MTLAPNSPPATLRAMPSRPPSCLVECRDSHLYYLCDRMRVDEIEQYLAVTGAKEYDPQVAARGLVALGGMRFTVLGPDGLPAASGGYYETHPGVWQSWMVGSEEGWRTNWRAMTKATRWLIDGMFEMGARRLETSVLASRTAAIEWYERGLGLSYEGTWRKRAANGADIACYARVED